MANHSCADFEELIQTRKLSLSESITENEAFACAYCAGLVKARNSEQFDNDAPFVPLDIHNLVSEVSCGGLVVLHIPTFEHTSVIAAFVKKFAILKCFLVYTYYRHH